MKNCIVKRETKEESSLGCIIYPVSFHVESPTTPSVQKYPKLLQNLKLSAFGDT